MEWNYKDRYKEYPIEAGQLAVWPDGSTVAINDIYNPVPNFMKQADLVVVDPPWNRGNVNTFYTKAGRIDRISDFEEFLNRVFTYIRDIDPNVCYLEIGKEYLADCIFKMRDQFKYVTFYNNTYYHKKDNKCYLIRGSKKAKKPDLDWLDEEDAIMKICEVEDYNCLCDFVMGQGLMARAAHAAGKKFVGGEMNPKRLSVLLSRIPGYEIIPADEFQGKTEKEK